MKIIVTMLQNLVLKTNVHIICHLFYWDNMGTWWWTQILIFQAHWRQVYCFWNGIKLYHLENSRSWAWWSRYGSGKEYFIQQRWRNTNLL